ncbi:hypothetical protein BDW59DRAFT_154398 [Aspergillus cavernicola]|uniref:Hpc2-related domain-containing protein n=1 Tax=Aspergillus cavernicola TaxID=176166 RepID=A0ABR4HI31_9EURO
MSTGPPVWSAQDEHDSRPPAETRPRRSRRKKDDEPDVDRKEPAKSGRSKGKEEKEKDKESLKEKGKEKEKEKEKGKDHDKEKESKPRRRHRDKSSSTSNNPTGAQSTPSHPRKKPKLESAPPEQSAITATTIPTAASTAPDPTSVSAPASTASVSPPKLSPPIAATAPSANHYQIQPQSHQQQPRPLNPASHLLVSSQPTPPQAPTPPPPSSYPTMISAPPSRPQSQPLAPPPQRTSGQNYDPIRSAFGTSSSAPTPPAGPASTSFSPPPRPISPRPFRASASPALSSIMNPPQSTPPPQYTSRPYISPSRGASSYPPTPVASTIAPAHPPLPPSLSSPYGHQSPYGPPSQSQPPQEIHVSTRIISSQPSALETRPSTAQVQQTPSRPTPMEVDSEPPAPAVTDKPPKKEPKPPSTAPSSKPPSPKPPRPAKEAPPPLPQGSGLISNALFGMDDSTSDTSSQRTPNIIVHIPLNKGNGNRIVNFARLAEEQYGFAALHPRLAAHKERMARVAAAGAALERNDRTGRGVSAGESADDDLTLDVDRDSELEGEGMTAGAAQANEPADGKKRQRKKKVEEYDRDDPFVDDSEMVWQEQAAASKDGFFVYSGPLVSEGEKVQVERADGTIKRGRGRAPRGGRSRAPATTHQQLPLAAAIPISQETGLPLRGPGSRGGNVNRRGRVSKKAEQDKSGGPTSVSHGRGGSAAGRGGSTSTRGGKTPMVELAPRPSLAPAPPGLNPMAGPEIASK